MRQVEKLTRQEKHGRKKLREAIKSGDVEEVNKYIEHTHPRSTYQEDALITAAMRGHIWIFQMDFQWIPLHVTAADVRKWSSNPILEGASLAGHEEIVDLLLTAPRWRAVLRFDQLGNALEVAAFEGNYRSVQRLLQEDTINRDQIEVALGFAAGNGHLKTVEMIWFDRRINPERRDELARTVVDTATVEGCPAVVEGMWKHIGNIMPSLHAWHEAADLGRLTELETLLKIPGVRNVIHMDAGLMASVFYQGQLETIKMFIPKIWSTKTAVAEDVRARCLKEVDTTEDLDRKDTLCTYVMQQYHYSELLSLKYTYHLPYALLLSRCADVALQRIIPLLYAFEPFGMLPDQLLALIGTFIGHPSLKGITKFLKNPGQRRLFLDAEGFLLWPRKGAVESSAVKPSEVGHRFKRRRTSVEFFEKLLVPSFL